jgi:hypothetical protein
VQFLGAMVIPTACNSTSHHQNFFRYFIDFQLDDFAIATLFPQQKAPDSLASEPPAYNDTSIALEGM